MRATLRTAWIPASLLLALTLLAVCSGALAAHGSPPHAPLPPTADPPSPPEASGPESSPLEPELLRALTDAQPDEYLRVIVHLREQAKLESVVEGALGAAEVRSRVVSTLQATAAQSQAPLRADLEAARDAGAVSSYTPFWVFNGVAVHARPSFIRALAARPEIAAIRLDHYRQWITAEIPKPKPQIPTGQPATDLLVYRSTDLPTSTEWGVARIRADQVWASLHISGTGAVVAGMDTGVDWLHPALQANYRGYNPHGPTNHTYSWYDAVGDALYPVDGHGHGSHTIGTAVGQGGIGVAPGAQWIAVKVLDSQGYGYDSWIHAGFQWLLAPGGDPAKTPDVVNCSWASSNGRLTVFQPDLRALRAAGIFAVFSNGNDGPWAGTVGSPASLPDAFAVGALDPDDEVASFSSRGPSPWGEIRPHVAAPGVGVRSSLPGGAYGSMNGTSMAAPHVAGVAALLRSVSPTLSITRTAFAITSTAVPMGVSIPNNDTGWGRVDGFAAVVALAHPGFVSGTVTWAADGTPIAGAMVTATPRDGGGSGTTTTGGDGVYLLALAPGVYDLRVTAFGYEPAEAHNVVVTGDTTTARDFALTALPFGILRGHVTDAVTGQPLAATVTVLETPFRVISDTYQFTLPAGSYTLRARSLGHRVVTATAVVTAGRYTIANLALPQAPTILLVDSGGWYYESQVGYFRQALDDLAYAYDEWTIKHLPGDVPTADDLLPYDIVVWSAPEDGPGYVGAEDAIVSFLDGGGRLFLSGQDVGLTDGGGSGIFYASYYHHHLKVRLVRDNANVWILDGTPGDLFAGTTITITGSGGADNQEFPDEIAVVDADGAAEVLAYQGNGCGGVRVGTCLDYRVIYLSFGFEAVNDRTARREIMDRALAWLVADPPTIDLELTPAAQTRIGPPGAVVTHTLRIRHLGQAGITDTFSLALDGASWASQVSTPSLTLSPCASDTVVVSVTVPVSAAWDARDLLTLTARSTLSPALSQTAVLTTKAPAPILLVDDDRWYEQLDKYQAAMEGAGLPYDLWQIAPALGSGGESPSSEILSWYPIVVWWTGYDWYRPVTAGERTALATYLDGGGRLFLSSQDFLYYHYDHPFTQNYLGVLSYTEYTTPTLAVGVPENPISDRLGPYALDFPFRNWADAVEPTPGTGIPFRDQFRRGIALNRREFPSLTGEDGYATAFFAFPFEALPEGTRPLVMKRIVGWLSWLGDSTFTSGRGAVSAGGTLTYTIVLRNDGPTTVTASLSNTLPVSVTMIPGSLAGPAAYDSFARRVSWQGPLGAGAAVTVTYRVTVAAGLPAGTSIANTARLGLEDHAIHFHRAAVVRIGTPDLSPSALWCLPSPALPNSALTCTLALTNAGPADALAATAAISLPTEALVVPGSLAWEGGGAAWALSDTVRWTGPLSAGSRITVTYQLTLPPDLIHPPLYSVAFLEDGVGGWWERPMWLFAEPLRFYLPLVFKSSP